eukprot:SAG31_NODE_232_length_19710_cov_17.109581_3_plen_429_part_00
MIVCLFCLTIDRQHRWVAVELQSYSCHTLVCRFNSLGPAVVQYVLPPNTLLTVVRVDPPPFTARFKRWYTFEDADGTNIVDRTTAGSSAQHTIGTFYIPFQNRSGHKLFRQFPDRKIVASIDYDPAEMFERTVHRRLLTVHATFLSPVPRDQMIRAGTPRQRLEMEAAQLDVDNESKFGQDVATLTYLDRTAYTCGHEELTLGLRHELADEWQDRAGGWVAINDDDGEVQHSYQDEWSYVNGAARIGGISYDGATNQDKDRDDGNSGLMPADFVARVNRHLLEKQSVPELLTLEEVLAVRLYTGPAFRPINGWLREVSVLPSAPPFWMKHRWGAYTAERSGLEAAVARRAAAMDRRSSFGATVGLLISAIRKLAAASTPAESSRPLYRGLVGVLASKFWLPDAAGLVAGTDAGERVREWESAAAAVLL